MTIEYNELLRIRFDYISTREMADFLGITHSAASRIVRTGKVPGIKIGRSYLVSRSGVEALATGYIPGRGRPRKKRKYRRKAVPGTNPLLQPDPE